MGVLSGYAIRLTIAQKTLYDRLRSQGIADDIARQLAVAIEKSVTPAQRLAKRVLTKVTKSSYHEAFASEAKNFLTPEMAEFCHQKAKARSGGLASGEARRAKRDDNLSELLKKAGWSEEGHPRDSSGKFSEGGGEIKAGRTVESAGLRSSYGYGGSTPSTDNAHTHLDSAREAIKKGDQLGNAGRFGEAAQKYAEAKQHIFHANTLAHSNSNNVTGKSTRASKEALAEQKKEDATSKLHSLAASKASAGQDEGKAFLHFLAAGAHAQLGGAVRRVSQAKLPNIALVKHLCSRALRFAKMGPLPAEFVAPTFVGEGSSRKRRKKKKRKVQKRVSFSLSSRILKSTRKNWQKLVYSVVYAPDTVDLHGDGMDAQTIERAAHEAMRKGIYVNHEHRGEPLGAHVVESYIAPCDMAIEGDNGRVSQVRKGTWVMGMKITDEDTWARVLDGTYKGFSLEGSGVAELLAA